MIKFDSISTIYNSRLEENLVRKVLELEGFYSNDPRDPGGETIFGLARKFHGDAPIFKQIDKFKTEGGDVLMILKKHKDVLYSSNRSDIINRYRNYLNVFPEGEKIQISKPLLCAIFCFSVNRGRSKAMQIINKSIDKSGFLNDYVVLIEILNSYKNLIKEKPNLKIYARGWVNRVIKSYDLSL